MVDLIPSFSSFLPLIPSPSSSPLEGRSLVVSNIDRSHPDTPVVAILFQSFPQILPRQLLTLVRRGVLPLSSGGRFLCSFTACLSCCSVPKVLFL